LIAVETEQRESVLPLVAAGAGATVLPKRLADTATDPRIVTASLSPAIRREIGLIWRTGPISPAAQAFLDISLAEA
jgi:DNA-binding transcriptional LysR family regulator